ncbi:MAG: amylo-alpha-1,6-glucosidase, partial [Verrucomicrobiae bacterium]|nr:amylo-alpha-1,6-glucosidase [Verrucomicrobiae bacterium]
VVYVVVCADPGDPSEEEIRKSFSPEAPSPGRESPTTVTAVLARAARSFLVRRSGAWSVVAGYPWFLEWGRDALVAARGLIALGWFSEVESLLRLYAQLEENGTLPNMLLGDRGGNRDTSDAPLWFGLACEEFACACGAGGGSGDNNHPDKSTGWFYDQKIDPTGRSMADVLRSVATLYLTGTVNGIKVDLSTGLVWSPGHFTWMDTNFPACTPREGYPIEIQALWVRLLRQLDKLGIPATVEPWGKLADRALESIRRLDWLKTKGWFADVLLASHNQSANEARPDNALRSNCLVPIALGVLGGPEARQCVAAAQKHLLVPVGVRSLAPLPVDPPLPIYGPGGRLLNDPHHPYWGRYEGDEDTRRKPAYHNGTAWVWTLPVFCEALARAWDFDPGAVSAATAYLLSAKRLLSEECIGQLPEIMDGDTPHVVRGCDAQAWSVTETLRVLKLLQAGGR